MRLGRAVTIAIATVSLVAALAPVAGAKKHRPEEPPPPEFQFAAIPWLTPADTALAMLAMHGYREVPGTRVPRSFQVEGRLFDRRTLVKGALDDQKRVIRWEITLLAPTQESKYGEIYAGMRKNYEDIVVESAAKYGARDKTIEKFGFPYERGDGREGDGLRAGLVTVRSEWWHPDGASLTVEMNRDLSVVLTYESQAWAVVEAQRRGKKASDL